MPRWRAWSGRSTPTRSTFAVLLLTEATLGERFGRRRMFTVCLVVFTLASAAAAFAPNADVLVAARAVQSAGGALVLPLSLTILSSAVPPARRGAALGFRGAMSGLAVAIGSVVGGAVTEGASWQWIFWLNVPVGVAIIPIAARMLAKGRLSPSRLDLPGVALVSAGLLGVVFGLVRRNAHGWTSGQVLGPIVAVVILLAVFAAWERRAPACGRSACARSRPRACGGAPRRARPRPSVHDFVMAHGEIPLDQELVVFWVVDRALDVLAGESLDRLSRLPEAQRDDLGPVAFDPPQQPRTAVSRRLLVAIQAGLLDVSGVGAGVLGPHHAAPDSRDH
jgi:hypothetical protein